MIKNVISDEEHSIVSKVSTILRKALKLTENAIAFKFEDHTSWDIAMVTSALTYMSSHHSFAITYILKLSFKSFI